MISPVQGAQQECNKTGSSPVGEFKIVGSDMALNYFAHNWIMIELHHLANNQRFDVKDFTV
ncbi:hypothetical protein [Candidatus Albibeggiatoa sp. nov. BB20]|uniref:hypothetical protein n=1 Tax=Candidatus Albibeggiatoa sp. nov. BB20 TaxID=3162723 RepID=UPI00336576A1